MKKLLALVLALVMSMSLVTISNAAFSDADKISHDEAVDMMSALGVINGMPDGSFNPSGNVTRAEMAKMITIISIGAIDPAAFVGTATDLKDINGHWAEGYIKYCYSQGIIAGKGNGLFDPNANVTAVEAAKMLLVALGYNANVQGYTGAQWTINVARDAQIKGFYKDLSVSALATLTRDEAAQMMYNAVNAKTIKETKTLNSDGTVSTHYGDDDAKLLNKTFKATTYEGQMKQISYNSDKKEYTYTVYASGPDTFTTTANYTDLYAQNVKVTYKTENGKTTVYGIYANDSKVIVSAPYYQVAAGSKNGEMKIDGTVYKISDAATTLSRYYKTMYDAAFVNETPTGASAAAMVKFIDNNDDGKIDFGVYTPFTVAKVTYAGTKSFTAGANYKYEDQNKSFTLSEAVAKDDQVSIVNSAYTFDNDTVITKLKTLSGKVVATNGVYKVQVDTTWYNKADSTTMALDSKYDFVVVNGYVVATEEASAAVKAEDYVVLVGKAASANNGFNGDQVKILKSDGTTEIKNYGTLAGATYVAFADTHVNTLYTVKNADQSGKVVLVDNATSVVNGKVGGFDGYTAGSYTKADGKVGKIDTYAIADDAVVFVKDTAKNETKVVTGAVLKQMTAATVHDAYFNQSKTTGYKTIVLAHVSSSMASSTGVMYGYVTGDVILSKNDDNATIASIKFWNGSEEVTLKTDAGNDDKLTKKGQAFSYKLDKDGNMTDVTLMTSADHTYVVAYDTATIMFNTNTQAYDVDKDTVIIYVDTDAKTGVDGGKVELAGKAADGSYINNVVYKADGDNDVNVLFVDIANEFKFVG